MNWWEKFYRKELIPFVGFGSPEQTKKEAEFVQSVLHLPAGAKLLDLCCGYGRHSYALAEYGQFDVTGLDYSHDFLQMTHQHPRVKYIHGDMRSIPFENHFDAVVHLFTSFGFFEEDEMNEMVLHQVSKSLKQRGVYLLDRD